MIVLQYYDYLPRLFSFLKIPLFVFTPIVIQIITFLHLVFQNSSLPRRSCYRFGKCRFPVLVLENCQLSRLDHLEDLVLENRALLRVLENIVFQNWKFLHRSQLEKQIFAFWKIKTDHSPSIRKKSRYWKIILLVCQSGRFASADHNKHTNIVCLYWKISNKMMFLLYIGKFHSDHDYMENFIRKI